MSPLTRRRSKPVLNRTLIIVLCLGTLSSCTTTDRTPKSNSLNQQTLVANSTPHSGISAKPTSKPTTGANTSNTPPTAHMILTDCTKVLSNQQVYDFNPNLGSTPNYSPNTELIQIVRDFGGIACGWSYQSSGELIEIAEVKLSSDAFNQRLVAAASGTRILNLNADVYFDSRTNSGTAQAFVNKTWIVVSSTSFAVAEDCTDIVRALLSNVD